jgi:hypothetical protein
VVAGHGFIHFGPGSPVRAFTAWTGSSWLLGGTLSAERLRVLSSVLHVLAGLATLACAAAVALAPWVPGWWQPLAIAAGDLGIAAFAVLWDGRIPYLFQEGAVGAVLSLAQLASGFVFTESFA